MGDSEISELRTVLVAECSGVEVDCPGSKNSDDTRAAQANNGSKQPDVIASDSSTSNGIETNNMCITRTNTDEIDPSTVNAPTPNDDNSQPSDDKDVSSAADDTNTDGDGKQASTNKNDANTANDIDLTALLARFLATTEPDTIIRRRKVRTHMSTLSIKGREAILHAFKQQRPRQRDAIISSMMENLTSEESTAVWARIEEEKVTQTQLFDQMREYWESQQRYSQPFPTSWSAIGGTWPPKDSSGWMSSGEEADNQLSSWEDSSSTWSSETGSSWGAPEELAEPNEDAFLRSEDSNIEPQTCVTDAEDEEKQSGDGNGNGDQQQAFDEHHLVRVSPDLAEINSCTAERNEENDSSGDIPDDQTETKIASDAEKLDPETNRLTEAKDDAFDINSGILPCKPGLSESDMDCASWTLPAQSHDADNVPNAMDGQDDGATLDTKQQGSFDSTALADPALMSPTSPRSPGSFLDESQTDGLERTGENQDDTSDDTENDVTESLDASIFTWDTQDAETVPDKTKALVEKVLPFVLDKDEVDFARTLKESIDLWYDRGERYKWTPAEERAKPLPGPSSLRNVESCGED